MNYSDKLKSPKWQKRRLDILNLHGFKCELCGSEEKTINVHHRFYLKGREPWEYDNDVFQVLCEDCHKSEHEPKTKIVEVVPKKFEEFSLLIEELEVDDLSNLNRILHEFEFKTDFERFIRLVLFVVEYGYLENALDLLEDKYKIDNLEIGLCMLQGRISDLENR